MKQFIKDPRVERWFKDRDMKVSFEKRRYMDIDWEHGLHNQARLTAGPKGLDANVVTGYGLKMLGDNETPGEDFPAPVVYQPPGRGARPWPLSGNHRGAAFGEAFPEVKTDGYEIYVYVVSDIRDPSMLDMAPRLLNTMESTLGYSEKERIAQARYAVENHRWPVARAAKEFGVSPKRIYVAKAVEEVREEIKDVPGHEILSPSTLNRLHAIESPRIRKEVTAVLGAHGVKGKEAEAVIVDVNKPKDDLGKTAKLAEWRDLFEKRNAPKKRGTNKGARVSNALPTQVRDAFFRHLTGLAKILKDKPTLQQLQISDPVDLSTMTSEWKVIVEGMTGVVNRAKPDSNGR